MKNNLLLLFCLSLLIACQEGTTSKKNAIDQSALPHGASLPNTNLSTADKATLAQATGKKAQKIQLKELEQLFDAAVEQLYVFNFWTLDCAACITNNQHLQAAWNDKEINGKMRLIFINLDAPEQEQAVNTFIREHNFFAATYLLTPPQGNWQDGIHEDWDGTLPATFMVNEKDAIYEMLQRPFEAAEAIAILQALTL